MSINYETWSAARQSITESIDAKCTLIEQQFIESITANYPKLITRVIQSVSCVQSPRSVTLNNWITWRQVNCWFDSTDDVWFQVAIETVRDNQFRITEWANGKFPVAETAMAAAAEAAATRTTRATTMSPVAGPTPLRYVSGHLAAISGSTRHGSRLQRIDSLLPPTRPPTPPPLPITAPAVYHQRADYLPITKFQNVLQKMFCSV